MSADQFTARPPPGRKPRCPHCGAEQFSAVAARCWLCEAPLAPGAAPETPAEAAPESLARFALPEPRGDNPAWAVFGVLALLVALGLAFTGPGLLVVLLILAIPALVRGSLAASRQAEQGRPLGAPGFASAFLSSVGIVAMVTLATVVTFYATCFVVCLGGLALNDLNRGQSYQWILVASVGAGLVPALWLAYVLFKRLWPRKG
jgi:hypothetical protein